MSAGGAALSESDWRSRQRHHQRRVEPWVTPRTERRRLGTSHPVDDFLFDYYPYSVAKLMAWHPGFGVTMLGEVDEYLRRDDYEATEGGATVVPLADRVLPRLRMTVRLLRSTAERAPGFGCFGLHEWAMVHKAEQTRHSGHALRVTPTEIEEVIDDVGLRCTHIDAYRFFTPAAIPLNAYEPTRATQHEWEQPGCVHANMDLYKYAMWFSPYVPSELIADCFELARTARDLDMRAAPYDLVDLGYEPIRVETPAGRREYALAQQSLAHASAPLRERLLSSLLALQSDPLPRRR